MTSLEKNRSEPVDVEVEEISTEVVPFSYTDVVDVDDYQVQHVDDIDLDPAYEQEVQATSSALERRVAAVAARPILMPVDHAKASAKWWAANLGRGAAWTVTHPHRIIPGELRHTNRGLGVMYQGWRYWKNGDVLAEAVKDTAATAPGYLAAATKAADARSKRRKISGALGLMMAGGGTAAWFLEPSLLLAAGGVGMALCNWIGRRNPPTDGSMPIPSVRRVALEPGAPLGSIAAQVINRLREEGVRVDPGGAMTVHAGSEYRMMLVHEDEITIKHLQSLERNLGGRPGSVRLIGTAGDAGVSEIRIATSDTLATLVDRPWVETGTRSVREPVVLGASTTEVPFAIPFAGVHMRVVAGTGGGKTKWILRSMIDALSACADVVIGGIDISHGPELPLWRGVIQLRGLNVEDAEKVLDMAIAEIDRRAKILAAIAEDDDPTNDADEWHSGLGPALVIFADEFSELAAFDGKKVDPVTDTKPNLLGKCETIVRTGRKHWVSLVMLTQKTGNDDFGSTTMQTQAPVSIAGPCAPADTNRMFSTERRDAGYTPHLLSPGVEGDPRDAGKVFIDSPMHRTPEVYRTYAPGTTSEVKRRARQRMADGLPNLDGTPVGEQEAVVLTPVQLAVEEIFAEMRDFIVGKCDEVFLPTATLLDVLKLRGHTVNAMQLGEELGKCGTRAAWDDKPQVRGYRLADIRKAWGV